MARARLWIVLAVAAAVIALLSLHAPYISGPLFFAWPYRALSVPEIYGSFVLCAVPFFAAQVLAARWRWLAVVLLMCSCMLLKIASVAFRPDVTDYQTPNLQLIDIIVENSAATSYYTDANVLNALPLREWLPLFPRVMGRLHLHTMTKPPGPVIYWQLWIDLLGYSDRAARIGGLVLGGLATLSIPATYLFLRYVLRDERAAFCGASFLSLCPGCVLFFPTMDPCYILLSTALIGFWHAALRTDRTRYALFSGLILGLCGIITFNLLVVGFFMAGLVLLSERPLRQQLIVGAKQAVVVLTTAGVLLLMMRAALGYDVIDTFRQAWLNQHAQLSVHAANRQYPQTILFDLTDFALGSGWISVPLVVFYFYAADRGEDLLSMRKLSLLALAQLLLVAAAGLLQSETARVWNFMLPLLMIPVAAELSRWSARDRLIAFAALLLVTAAVCQQVKFIY